MKKWNWLILVLLLIVVRFVNLLSLYFVNHLEIGEQEHAQYVPIGFAGKEKAIEKLNGLVQETGGIDMVQAVSAFDVTHSFAYYIYNPKVPRFVNLGVLGIRLNPGISTVAFSPVEMITFSDSYGRTLYRYRGISMIAPLMQKYEKRLQDKVGGTGEFSFMIKSLENSRYLFIPYLVYFFLPLVIIILAAGLSDISLMRALFYYIPLFLLFDYKRMFVLLPFGWLFRLFGLSVNDTVVKVIAYILLALFVFVAVKGLFYKHVEKSHYAESRHRFLFFFLLLPFLLRF